MGMATEWRLEVSLFGLLGLATNWSWNWHCRIFQLKLSRFPFTFSTKCIAWMADTATEYANLLFKLWSMDIVTMDIMIYDSTGPLQGSTGWYLMVLGQYGVILVVTRWYWVSITWYWLVLSCTGLIKGFYACIYWKKLMVTSTNQPTDQPTDQQGEYRAICLFEC